MTVRWPSIMEQATALRHALHQHPELSWQEENTAATIRAELDKLDIPWRSCAQHGTIGTLAPNAHGKHIALRADIDALPINESTGLSYSSTIDGCMHACGHDGHTATLWATAAWLKQHEEKLTGPVSLLFQPAEEGAHGAKKMVEDGALKGVDEIYGWHNWPALPFGQAVCPDGPVMSGNGTFHIELQGKGGHASQPEACIDPVLAAAAVTLNLQQIVSRRMAPQSAVVISVTSIDAVSSPTVIPNTTKVEGSIRLTDPTLQDQISELITQITKDTASSYGVDAKVLVKPCYEATINHAGPAKHYREILAAELGDQWKGTNIAVPIMASEDFSYYLNEIPGAYALIGMGQEEHFCAPCHSPNYEFNDELIPSVVRVFSKIVGIDIMTQ